MSDTPRSDGKIYEFRNMDNGAGYGAMLNFARTLERELSARTADLSRIQNRLNWSERRIEELQSLQNSDSAEIAKHVAIVNSLKGEVIGLTIKLDAQAAEIATAKRGEDLMIRNATEWKEKAVDAEREIAALRADAERWQELCKLMTNGLLHIDRSDSDTVETLTQIIDKRRVANAPTEK